MDFFARPRRAGETQAEYAHALQAFVAQCLARECPGVSLVLELAGTPSLISATSATQPKPEPAGTPSLIGATSASPPKLISYKKTGGAADGAGESYEWKMLTLLFVRMLAAGLEFQLASNMEAAGLFDDIVVRHRTNASDPWRVAYLQLKHKQHHKKIRKAALLGFSGDFSLIKYCASFASMPAGRNDQFIIFTTASMDETLVDSSESNKLFSTGGKVVAFKTGGDVCRELCEWVDFKEALADLHGQLNNGWTGEVKIRVNEAVKGLKYKNNLVALCKEDLLKHPTLETIEGLLKKLTSVSDKDTYSTFLTKLQVYSNQANESKLDAKIKEELAKVWKSSDPHEEAIMFHELLSSVKAWWQKDKFFLTQDSPLWLGIVKSWTQALSESTVAGLTKSGAEFAERCLEVVHNKICEVASSGGVLHLRVDSRTLASSLKVYQALAKFGEWDLNPLHVNVQTLMAREDDVLSAWATRWCRVLVVECDVDLGQKHAARISARILKVLGRKDENKLLVLIAPEKHELNLQLYHAEGYQRFNDNVALHDLTEKSRNNLLALRVVMNGSPSPLSLADLVSGDKRFANKADMEVVSQLLSGDVCCGKDLEEVGKLFVTRRLKKSTDGVPFVVNSVSDVPGKVVLVVAEPGMGKSTLVTHLAQSAKAEDPAAWVVFVKLNDSAQQLTLIDVENFSESAARRFLEHFALGKANRLEKLLYRSLEHKLVIFIDGIDEVCPHYERQIFTLLTFLKDMNICQLWVTSRPVFQTKLEDKLRVETLQLVAFSNEDQTAFFNKAWMEKDPIASPEKCSEVTENLMTRLTDSLGKDNHILGVPLMTAMIAETFQRELFALNNADNKTKKSMRLDVMLLYKTFVRKKFDVYCIEKKKTPSRELAANISDEVTLLERVCHHHLLAALRVLFSREEIARLEFDGKEKFDDDLAAYLKEVSDGREKIGIIDNVIDGIPHFIHRSFSEYFFASWLSFNFKKNGEFIQRIIFDPAYKLVAEMFNRCLAQDHPVHIAVLNRDWEETERILSAKTTLSNVDALDDGGRTPLHLAVLFGDADRHQNCMRTVNILIQKHKARLDIPDEILHWEPLRYAERAGAWMAMHLMLENGAHIKKGRLISGKTKSDDSKPDPRTLLEAAEHTSVIVVRYLFEGRGGKVDCRGPHGETMVHRAAQGGNAVLLGYLRSKGLSLDVKDNDGNTALRYASPQATRYLIDCGLKTKVTNKRGLTALQDAAQHGATDVMDALLEAGVLFQMSPTPKVRKAQLNASLLCAAYSGSLESAQRLVAMGASPDHRDDNGHTAARVAMQRGHCAVVDWLLLRDAKNGDAPLHAACDTGEVDFVSFVLARGVDVDARGWREQTPLISATRKGHVSVAKLLLERDACVDCSDKYARTSLHHASSEGHEHLVELLLRHGADADARDGEGRTPLHAAAWANRLAAAQLLLTRGAGVNHRDRFSWTPLHIASAWGHDQLAALLLLHGADVTATCDKGRTPLHTAAWNNKVWNPTQAATANSKLAVVQMLLEKGGNAQCHDANGWTPLATASSSGHVPVVALLLRHGADVGAEDSKGRRPLHVATWNNQLQVVQMLLEHGVDVESRDGNAWTALHLASQWGHERLVALLLRHGADVRVVDNQGRSPLSLATEAGHSGVAELLKEAGAVE